MVKSDSLGRNKLVVNHLGKLFVTSDAATIIREIEVVHPAAKILVMALQAQEAEARMTLELNGTITYEGHSDGGRDKPCTDFCRGAIEEGRKFINNGTSPE